MSKPQFKDLILVETDDFIVINKPPFVATLEDRVMDTNILSMARGYHAESQVCHRLDKETSGALVIAKHPEAYRHMSMQFQNRQVSKIYHAVSEGIHDFNALNVEDAIRKLGNGTVCIDKRKGRDAQTIFTTLHAYKKHTLVECRPVTGRMHQIRIHLAHYGAPISGDIQYGGHPFFLSNIKPKYRSGRDEEEQPLIRRLALHAKQLTFEDLKGEKIAVEAPYPKDFRVLVTQLEKNS
ncbi:RluA family pseudouridine synthase [Fulvivirga sedimenti]|uniref:RNA pseudouridine synthase n=1 Tax=Fulvivirga sedimenti TaxID=2879465 RepID=A0A9X1HPI3_9BACT|nr:RNA pseudouridine synthase [Fulvivirga sedimenti]MCA6073949.1 RNA pseudouridine synthase [Fulvivirga sedimenti]